MEQIEVLKKAKETVALLKERGMTVATAESCTGGLVAAFLTSVSGVSEVFELGVTSYSCRIKNKVLGVEKETLEKLGAISKETAYQMAENIRRLADSDIGISVTGVAGPESSEGHPVGYIFIGISGEKGTDIKLLDVDEKDRNSIRLTTVSMIFDMIINYLGQ